MSCITYTIQRRLLDVWDEHFKFFLLDCPRGGRPSSCSRTCAGTSCSAAGVWTEDHRTISYNYFLAVWGSWKFEWIRGPSPWFGYYKDLLSPSGIKKWSIVLVVDTDVVIVMQCFLSILTCCLYNMFSLLTGSWNQTPTERNCMKFYILILSWMIRRLGGPPGRSFWNGESLQDIAVMSK